MSVFLYGFYTVNWVLISVFALICYILSFIIIQVRVERFIYRRVKKIYDDLTLLESTNFTRGPVNTDMGTLTEEIDRFARDKKLEIETLKVREQYRKEFFGNVAHELKTPLFTVQGYILTLLDGAMDDDKIRKKYLDMFEMKANRKKITLAFDIDYPKPIMVNADRERIQQVLINLIVNSIKYGLEKGTTEVSIENLIKNKVIVRITDNGIGIGKTHLPRLFERFYRVDKSGSRTEGGSGLGLSIVKHIIEAHNEKIYVESELGVGSEFSFTLEKTK